MGAPLSTTACVAEENRSDDGVDSPQSLRPDRHSRDKRHNGEKRSSVSEEETHDTHSFTDRSTMFLFCSYVNGTSIGACITLNPDPWRQLM
jgi:hypothetical protein